MTLRAQLRKSHLTELRLGLRVGLTAFAGSEFPLSHALRPSNRVTAPQPLASYHLKRKNSTFVVLHSPILSC